MFKMNTEAERLAIGLAILAMPAPGAYCRQWFLDAEAGAAVTGYNDVRIPSDSGTFFSLADDIVPSAAPARRLRFGASRDRHSLFALAAPLTVRGRAPWTRTSFSTGSVSRPGRPSIPATASTPTASPTAAGSRMDISSAWGPG